MLKIAPKRVVKMTHHAAEGEDDTFSIDVCLPSKEDMNFELIERFKSLYPEGSDSANYNMYLYLLRSSIVGTEGILDEEGKSPDLKDPSVQKAVFDAVWDYEDIRENLKTLISGVSEKN